MEALQEKSLKLTAYLEDLLDSLSWGTKRPPFEIITPRNPEERGAQLSVYLEDGLLDTVLEYLEEEGAVVDERKPNVIRVAPAPLYNTFEDVWRFVQTLQAGCWKAMAVKAGQENSVAEASSVMLEGGRSSHG